MITSPQWIALQGGKVATTLNLPRQGVSLVPVNW